MRYKRKETQATGPGEQAVTRQEKKKGSEKRPRVEGAPDIPVKPKHRLGVEMYLERIQANADLLWEVFAGPIDDASGTRQTIAETSCGSCGKHQATDLLEASKRAELLLSDWNTKWELLNMAPASGP